MDTQELKETVVIYHDKCIDGFGAAYAAWKKFGTQATYIPRVDNTPPPEGLQNKKVYILDYWSYSKETLQDLESKNTSVTVIDHHETARETVESFPGNIFDQDHSGAVLAWRHFHPDTEVPELLKYVEDHDLWKFKLPQNREFLAALGFYPQTFESWDLIINTIKEPRERTGFIQKGKLLVHFEKKQIQELLSYKEKVQFEGKEIWSVNAPRTYRSVLGHRLAGMSEEASGLALGIVYYRYDGAVHVSLRSHGEVDVEEIAKKHGGGGHKNAASFRVKSFADLPFTFIERT